jgi:hypothetical protein
MLMIKERLLRAWLAYKRWTGLSFPRRFSIVQFPNLPLIVAALAGEAGKLLDGSAHSYRVSVLPGDDDMGIRGAGARGQLVGAPPGTGLRDSPGRAPGRRVARLIWVADVTLLPYASDLFSAACRRACRPTGLLRADGSGPLAGVPLAHDEIIAPSKSRRDAGPVQPGDRAARRGPGAAKAATSITPATIPAVVRISLNPNKPIHTDRR